MDDLYRNIGQLNPLKLKDAEDAACRVLNVAELWLDESRNETKEESRTIDTSKLIDELNWTSRPTPTGTQVLILRLVWVDVTKQRQFKNLSKQQRKILLNKFGLDLAYTYLPSCIAGVTAFPPKAKGQEKVRAYSVSYAPKLGALWSHTTFDRSPGRQPLTQGIILTQTEDDVTQDVTQTPPSHKQTNEPMNQGELAKQTQTKSMLQALLMCHWQADVCKSSQFPTFLLSVMLGLQVDYTKEIIRKELSDLEEGTNHHSFTRTPTNKASKKADSEIWKERSEQASGHASKLASASRKGKMVDRLLNFILKELDEEETAAGVTSAGAALLRPHVAALQERLKNQTDDIEFTIKRCQIQIEAVFSLIAQADNLANVVQAKASTKLSLLAFQDASSMKTLAFVTMFFLPGSFVSALFSTSLFNWDARDINSGSIGLSTTPQMSLYWIITVLLTLATFFLYWVWLQFLKRQSTEKVQGLTNEGQPLNEKEALEAVSSENDSTMKTRKRWTLPNRIMSHKAADTLHSRKTEPV